jgi:uncharacterized protein (DUF305 family)
MMRSKWIIFGILVLSLIALTTTTSFAAPSGDRGARAEVRFLEEMMDHHQMAVDMANDCLKKAKTGTVITLCKNVIAAQTAEIKQMHDWLLAWYQIEYSPMPMSQMMNMMGQNQGMGMIGGMHMGGMTATPDMNGMMAQMPDDMPLMMGMMAGLSKLDGKDYEIAWIEAMIDHHSMAIGMSQQLLPRVQHPELKKLAQSIIDDQTAEIQKMEGLLTQFGDK